MRDEGWGMREQSRGNPVVSGPVLPSRITNPSSVFSAALDLFLPRACVACDSLMSRGDTGIVCGVCWSRIQQLPSPQCDRCGHPSISDACQWCELLPAYVRAVRSVCWMPIEPASSIVHALKYEGWSTMA